MKRYIVGFMLFLVCAITILFYIDSHHNTSVPAAKTQGAYVALGDSVAAGVGLKYDSDSSACNRTNQAYPRIIANDLNYTLNNDACSGATLPNGVLGKQDVNDLLVTPQLQQLFSKPTPKLITITVGANDADWTSILRKCYTSECGTSEDDTALQANLATVTTNIEKMLDQIRQHYTGARPTVIVTGYYQVFSTAITSKCSDLTGIDESELAWGRQLQSSINNTLEAATKGSTAKFIPIDFSGHELCTSDPWVQGLSDNEPYHPTATGQVKIANQIIRGLKDTK